MRIESFWARGFRSLRDVHLENLGPFNVFYGPNGAGKSNILAAIDAWLRLAAIALDPAVEPHGFRSKRGERARGKLALEGSYAPVHRRDFALASNHRMVLEGTLVNVFPGIERATIGVQLDATIASRPSLTIDGDLKPPDVRTTGVEPTAVDIVKRQALGSIDFARKLSLVAADRMPRVEAAGERPPAGAEPLSWYFRRGQLKTALFTAQNAPSPTVVRALDELRKVMAGPPLCRPPLRPVQDPGTQAIELHERLAEPNPEGLEVPLDLAGLGIAQIYWILAQAMLSGADIVAIEEPEAHLHAPTSGLHLRELLQRIVDEKHIDQLFIATHSNLFDLDPQGYFDVSLADGETVVVKKPLDAIDRHLYEPGPAKHALQRMLQHMPPDEMMFRDKTGAPVSAAKMLELLREDDPLAVDFLKDVHGAAVTMVKVANKKAK